MSARIPFGAIAVGLLGACAPAAPGHIRDAEADSDVRWDVDAGSPSPMDATDEGPACLADGPAGEARTYLALRHRADWVHQTVYDGFTESGVASFETRPDSEVVTLTVAGSSTLSIDLFPVPTIEPGQAVTVRLQSVRVQQQPSNETVTYLDEYVVQIEDLLGIGIAAYWGLNQYPGQQLIAEPQFEVGNLLLEYRASNCDPVPLWGVLDCGDGRPAALRVIGPSNLAITVPAGAIVELPDGYRLANSPSSYFDRVNPKPCTHVASRSVKGFLLR